MLLNFKYLKILNLLRNCNKHVQSLIEKLQNLNLFVKKKKKHQFEVMQMLEIYRRLQWYMRVSWQGCSDKKGNVHG